MGRILSDSGAAALTALRGRLEPTALRGLMATIGREAERQYRAHFRAKEASSPNKRGFPRQHFWARIRQATSYDESATTASSTRVVVDDPALLPHVYGATIRPKQKKLLAIPNQPQAYGSRPSSGLIPDLFFFENKKGTKGLAKEVNGKFTVFYWLKESVTIPADPAALPPPATVEAALLKAAESYVTRRLRT